MVLPSASPNGGVPVSTKATIAASEKRSAVTSCGSPSSCSGGENAGVPDAPAALTRRLLDYERAVLALPADADEERLAEALALHPLAPRAGLREVARQLAAVKVERFALT